MDLDLFTRWAGAAALVLSIVNVAWIVAGRAAKPITEKLKSIEDKVLLYRGDLVNHDRRIQTLEGNFMHIPSKDQFADLRIAVTKLEGHLGRLDDAVGAVSATVRSIDNYLREEK